MELPPELGPSRHLDWSSIASPPARASPHGAHDVQPAQNQLNVPAAIGTRQERDEVGTSEGVTIAPQMDVLREDQGIYARPTGNIDTRAQSNILEPSEENVDIIPPASTRSARSSPHTEDVMPSVPQGSSTNDDRPRCSQLRSHTIEGMSSICPADSSIISGIRQIALDDRGHGLTYQSGGIQPPRTSTINRRDSSDSSDSDRFHRERGRPPERERYPSRERRPPR